MASRWDHCSIQKLEDVLMILTDPQWSRKRDWWKLSDKVRHSSSVCLCVRLRWGGTEVHFLSKFSNLRELSWHRTWFLLQQQAALLCWQPWVNGTSRAHPFVQLLYHSIHLKGMLSLVCAVPESFDLPTARGESIVIHSNFYCLLAKLQSRFALRGGCGVWGDVWSLILSVFRDASKVKM